MTEPVFSVNLGGTFQVVLEFSTGDEYTRLNLEAEQARSIGEQLIRVANQQIALKKLRRPED